VSKSRLDDQVNTRGLSSLCGPHDRFGMIEGEKVVFVTVHN
jgi:hypothetical protein